MATFIGAVATVAADTWASDLSTISHKQPRKLTTGQRVECGTPDAVTFFGFGLAVLDGLITAGLLLLFNEIETALFYDTPSSKWLLTIGPITAFIGTLADSLINDLFKLEVGHAQHHIISNLTIWISALIASAAAIALFGLTN